MHPTIPATLRIMGILLLGLVVAALLPLGQARLPVVGGVLLALGLGCFRLVALAYVHGQVAWRTGIYHARHDRFYFLFYSAFYALAGLLCILAGTGGLLA